MEKVKGKGNFANMPTEHKQTQYPKYPHGNDKEIDDTMTGVDKVNSTSASKRNKNVSNQK